jgi:hypothetical protein
MSDRITPVPAELCDIYHLLRQQRRCYLVLRMATGEPPHTPHELARPIAGDVYNVSTDEVGWREYQNVLSSLHTTHIDALADAAVVDVDPDTTQLVPGPQFGVALLLIRIGVVLWTATYPGQESASNDATTMADEKGG